MASIMESESKRKRLEIRHAPYWEKISRGRSIGFRKGVNHQVWMARCDIAGKLKYTTFKDSGALSHAEALDAAAEWFGQLANVEISAWDMSVKDAVDHYEHRLMVEKKNVANVQQNAQRVRKHLSDNLSTTKLGKITQKQVIYFRDSMVVKGDEETIRKSKVSANRVLNIFKAVLNLAYQDQLIGSKIAWDTVKSFIDVDEARSLYLTDKQVNDYLQATTGAFHDLCKACILTGNRVGSLSVALVRDFDKSDGTLRLKTYKGNGKVKVWSCYLSVSASAFFAEMAKGKLPKAPLLANDNGAPWGKNLYRRDMLAAKIASKMPADFNLYTFRHYHISKALLAGIQAQIVAENCGTSVRMIEKHYGKFMGADRRAMMDLVELGI